MFETPIEKLIPHRDGMKLLDDIIEVNEAAAVTSAVVKKQWPLTENGGVNPLVLIELAAQTSAIAIGWKTLQDTGSMPDGSGLLVGVKNAEFHIGGIPLNACIITRSSVRFTMESYTEITGISTLDDRQISEITLQVIRTDKENEND